MATQGPTPVNTGTTNITVGPAIPGPTPLPPGPGTTGQIPTVTAPVGPPESAPPPVAPGPGTGQSTRSTVAVTAPVIELPVDTTGASSGTPNVIPRVPNYIEVLANGTIIVQNATALNFTGSGVTATAIGGVATLEITSGGSYGNSNVSTFLAAYGSNTVVTTGNITGGYFIGNGSQLTGVTGTYGNANVVANLAALGSNPVSTTGNITGGNVIVSGLISAAGNITGGNILGGANVNATTHTGTTVSVSATITGGNVLTGGLISATGNITGGNLSAVNLVINNIRSDDSSFVNIEDGVNITGAVVASGNIIGAAANIPSIVSQNLDVENISARGSAGVNIGAGGFNNLVVEQAQVLIQNVPLSVSGNVTSGNVSTGKVANTGNLSLSAGANSWTFDTTGNLTVPGSIILPPGAVLTGTGASPSPSINGFNTASFGGDISSFANITGGNLFANTNVHVAATNGNLVLGDATATASPGVSSTSSLTITANRNGTAKYWVFTTTGEFDSPGVVSAPGVTAPTIITSSIRSDDSSFVNIEDGLNVSGDIVASGNITGGNINTGGRVVTTPVAYSTLTAVTGARAFVNDGNLVASGNFGAQVSGGGANTVPIWSDGTNWYIG